MQAAPKSPPRHAVNDIGDGVLGVERGRSLPLYRQADQSLRELGALLDLITQE